MMPNLQPHHTLSWLFDAAFHFSLFPGSDEVVAWMDAPCRRKRLGRGSHPWPAYITHEGFTPLIDDPDPDPGKDR